MKTIAAISLALALVAIQPAAGADPDFGPNVVLLSPDTPDLQGKISAVAKQQDGSQFGGGRYALLFKPGKYNADVLVGFYTSVNGLGKSPELVAISGAVRASAKWMGGNATCNFWRSVENVSIAPSKGGNTWAVSQGTAFRHSHVKSELSLSEGGWSSGGFLADCKIDGNVNSGSQQQWLTRNSDLKDFRGGAWNMVFVGCTNPPGSNWPRNPVTVIDKTPLIREKPYLVFDTGKYYIEVPPLSTNTIGTSWTKSGKQIPIEKCYISKEKDTSAIINAALASGKSLILTPGIYHLDEAIKVTQPDTVILGLGYATLIPNKGAPAISVADVDGVTIAGVLLEASMKESATLLEVGEKGSSVSHAANPTALFDIFARNGGASNGVCSAFVTINSNNVIGDNFWLWRADHGAGAGWNSNKNKNAVVVNGKDVTIYGLFCEHSQEYQTLWNADGGRVFFYQSELPYDPPSTEAWSHDKVKGYASYKVSANVKTHEAYGLGIYSVFKNGGIVSDTAIEAPTGPGIKLKHMVTLKLGGGGISHILNNTGGASGAGGPMKATLD